MKPVFIEIGKNLIEVKQAIGHGNWLPWLAAEFGWSRRTAHRFMQVAESFSNVPRVGHLNVSPKALYLLAQNSTPEEVREDAIAMAETGETVTTNTAKELKEKDEEIARLKAELDKTKEQDLNNLIPVSHASAFLSFMQFSFSSVYSQGQA